MSSKNDMSSNNDITELNPEDLEKSQPRSPLHPRSKSRSHSKSRSKSRSHSKSHSKSHSTSPSTPPREPKYIFIGFFTHGGYDNKTTVPYRVNPYASRSLTTFRSTPKLMTFTNSSPGNIVLGSADGSDNTKLKNYFETNSNINFLTDTNQNESAKEQEQIIAKNFLSYAQNGLAIVGNPRDDLDHYRNNLRKTKKEDTKKIEEKYVSRNSFILNNKVGIGHTFTNKTFTTDDPSANKENMDSWGIFIFNNNCGIEPGTRIEELLPEIPQDFIYDKDDEEIGIRLSLDNIIRYLGRKYDLTSEDYLFLFDFTCSVFIEEMNPRVKRSWARQISKDLGFGIKRTKKRTKKVNKKGSKKIKLKQKVFKN
jgi:hypothetical protein